MSPRQIELTGTIASPGIATGTAFVYAPPDLAYEARVVESVDEELRRLRSAVTGAIAELVRLKERTRGSLGDEFAHIFRSQQTIAEDESILGEIEELIREAELSAESALDQIYTTYRSMFDELGDDDYNKARAADLDDVRSRILRLLLGLPERDLSTIHDGAIVVAYDLVPSDTALLDPARVRGIVTETGGPSSHVAILSKTMGIPAAVAVGRLMTAIGDGDRIALDTTGEAARVVIHPSPEFRTAFLRTEEDYRRRRDLIEQYRGLPAQTPDGTDIVLSANVGSTADLIPARDAGARSVGLYRSEFLFLNARTLPNEDRQYEAYRRAAETFPDGFVIIRTLDVGGDKQIPALPLPAEENPFLGKRALRLSLDRPDLFRTQLRAILRASAHGPVKMMFPMVGGVPELDQALSLVEEVKAELRESGIAFDSDIEVGIMVEVPSAVWVADALAQRVSFFSVGTNDLTQYLLAADRLNGDVQEYYRAYDPSVFRAIAEVAAAAARHNRWVGVCGELGGDPRAIPALIGLGVTELSMSAGALAEATWAVRSTPLVAARELAEQVLSLDAHLQIHALLGEYQQERELQ